MAAAGTHRKGRITALVGIPFLYGGEDVKDVRSFPPSDLEQIINGDSLLDSCVNSFQLGRVEDDRLNSHLQIHLEKKKDSVATLPSQEELFSLVFAGLIRVNQDFREVTRMFHPDQVTVVVHEFETGPFAGRDIRIKNNYIAH